VVIFFDRSMPRSVVDALAQVRADVVWLEPTFAHDTRDEAWLAQAGTQGWIVVTRDRRIRTRPAERAAIERYDVGAFVLTQRQSMSRWNVLKIVVANLDEMERLFANTARPFLFTVSSTAGIRRLL
jgi:predicted nuclease of predicted toxin-antitoxin system